MDAQTRDRDVTPEGSVLAPLSAFTEHWRGEPNDGQVLSLPPATIAASQLSDYTVERPGRA